MFGKLSRSQIFAAISVVGFLVVVVLGFTAIGSPTQTRAKKFDQEKLDSIKIITRAVNGHAEQNQRLPESLQFLKDSLRNHELVLNDPNTGEPYEYRLKSDYSYEVCANFEAEYQPEEVVERSGGYGFTFFDVFGMAYDGRSEVRTYVDREWFYEPGEWCFERDLSDVLHGQRAPSIVDPTN